MANTWSPERLKKLRGRYGETQEEFCRRLRMDVESLRVWEQGKGAPNGAAQALLDRLDEDVREGKIRPLPQLAGALLALLLLVPAAIAADPAKLVGKMTRYDAENSRVTVRGPDGKEKEFWVNRKSKAFAKTRIVGFKQDLADLVNREVEVRYYPTKKLQRPLVDTISWKPPSPRTVKMVTPDMWCNQGRVMAIDPKAGLLTISRFNGKQVTVKILGFTTCELDGKKAAAAKAKVGFDATVCYDHATREAFLIQLYDEIDLPFAKEGPRPDLCIPQIAPGSSLPTSDVAVGGGIPGLRTGPPGLR